MVVKSPFFLYNKVMKNKSKLIILISSLILFIAIAIMISCGKISWFDDPIYNFIISFKSDGMTKFMTTITKAANTKTIIILCIAALTSLIKKYKGSLFLLANVILSTILNVGTKYIFCRARPDHLRLITQGGYSFPSGHAMASVSFYGFLIFLVLNSNLKKSEKIIISTILSILIILIGISRIYVGVHYPSDILGGWLISLSLLMVTTYLIKKYWKGLI
jgi:undecaprenyl-diphosphatase